MNTNSKKRNLFFVNKKVSANFIDLLYVCEKNNRVNHLAMPKIGRGMTWAEKIGSTGMEYINTKEEGSFI